MTHEMTLPRWLAVLGGLAMGWSRVCIVIQAWFSMADNEARGWTYRPPYEWAPMMAAGLALAARATTIWLGSGLTFLFLMVCLPMSAWQSAALFRSVTRNGQRRKIAKAVAEASNQAIGLLQQSSLQWRPVPGSRRHEMMQLVVAHNALARRHSWMLLRSPGPISPATYSGHIRPRRRSPKASTNGFSQVSSSFRHDSVIGSITPAPASPGLSFTQPTSPNS